MYHLEVTVGREEVISQVEEGQDTAHSPHINSLGERKAEGNFGSSEKKQRATGEKSV